MSACAGPPGAAALLRARARSADAATCGRSPRARRPCLATAAARYHCVYVCMCLQVRVCVCTLLGVPWRLFESAPCVHLVPTVTNLPSMRACDMQVQQEVQGESKQCERRIRCSPGAGGACLQVWCGDVLHGVGRCTGCWACARCIWCDLMSHEFADVLAHRDALSLKLGGPCSEGSTDLCFRKMQKATLHHKAYSACLGLPVGCHVWPLCICTCAGVCWAPVLWYV